MKIIITLIFLVTFSFSFSQNDYYDIVSSRKDFRIINDSTIISKPNKTPNLKPFCEYLDNKNLLNRYKSRVFRYSNKNSKKVFYVKQWNTQIIVYLDEKIPKEQKKELTNFFIKFNNINNLVVTCTNDIEKANYYIKVIDKSKHGYNEDYTFDNEEERRTFPLTNTTYNLLNDKSLKFYCGVLSINSEEFKNDLTLAIKKIKQVFFMSLGDFSLSYFGNKDSLLSDEYVNSDTLSKEDIDILKIHYSVLYDQKIHSNQFDEILTLTKTYCNDN